jgi:hypothetical protein
MKLNNFVVKKITKKNASTMVLRSIHKATALSPLCWIHRSLSTRKWYVREGGGGKRKEVGRGEVGWLRTDPQGHSLILSLLDAEACQQGNGRWKERR